MGDKSKPELNVVWKTGWTRAVCRLIQEAGFARTATWIILSCGALAVVGFYILQFAAPNNYRLSNDPEDWARFGEYVGGLFGMLAFFGVLWTIGLQQVQIEKLTRQATSDELQRITREISSRVDETLDKEIISHGSYVEQILLLSDLPLTTRGVLDLVEVNNAQATNSRAAVLHTARIACTELDEVSACLCAFQDQGGSAVIARYYQQRYRAIVRRLGLLGYNVTSASWWAEDGKNKTIEPIQQT